jgi:hypothetical protein
VFYRIPTLSAEGAGGVGEGRLTVSATPTTSRPAKPTGRALPWIPVGLTNPSERRDLLILA